MSETHQEFTVDRFLDGRLKITQPKSGYRAGSDAVLLASAVEAVDGQSCLELGCGVGVASFCLMTRVPGIEVCGVEIQPEYAEMAIQNARNNELDLEIVVGDVNSLPHVIRERRFNHVFFNPPYFVSNKLTPANNAGRNIAHISQENLLADWIRIGGKRCLDKGTLTVIVHVSQFAEALREMEEKFGGIEIFTINSMTNSPASRVILRGYKGSMAPLKLHFPLVMHQEKTNLESGSIPSELAESILRQGQSISNHFHN